MTKPIIDLHPGDDQDQDLKVVLDQFSSSIDELVNYGSHVLSWDLAEATGGDENLAVTLIFRNILENLDAISILIKRSGIDPAKNLLRVVFESILGPEFMLDVESQRRALAFLITGYHKELKLCNKLTEGQQTYVQLKQKLQSDKTLPNDILPPEIDGLLGHIGLIQQMVALPFYAEAEAEYQAIISGGTSNPAWYQFYGGPRNLEQLANSLNRQGIYEVLYRAWSGAVHGSDVLKGKIVTETDGSVAIVQIRHPQDAQQVTQYAHSLALILFRFYIEKRLPSHKDDLDSWYQSIRDVFLRLHGPQLINITF
jgi:hypothetical protein